MILPVPVGQVVLGSVRQRVHEGADPVHVTRRAAQRGARPPRPAPLPLVDRLLAGERAPECPAAEHTARVALTRLITPQCRASLTSGGSYFRVCLGY